MKQLLNLFAGLLIGTTALSQSVGIGTNNPDPSAILHLNSTTKGILIPSMTNVQRLALANPAEGLIVYDLTLKGLYQFQNGVWRQFITTDYWVQSNSRQAVYNLSDSVGIGTASPTERLSVNGNIRISGDIKTVGDVGAGTTTPAQPLHVVAGANNEGILLDGPNPQIQLRQQVGLGVSDKGFVQLNGDDLRLGTNSSNTAGRVVVRTGGTDRVSVGSAGINLISNTQLTRTNTGAAHLLPVCMGFVDNSGTINHGTGNFTVEVQPGPFGGTEYVIRCPDIKPQSVVMVTNGSTGGAPEAQDPTNGAVRLFSRAGNIHFVIYTLSGL